ncbi:MAG TPA: hypothetical protein VG713_12405 [Pirellulales bacterium]|nr:hypothetical protein [Pirellulales bacterium]
MAGKPDPDAFYSELDVARLWGAGLESQRAGRKDGSLKYFVRGSAIIYRGIDVQNWLEGNGSVVAAGQATIRPRAAVPIVNEAPRQSATSTTAVASPRKPQAFTRSPSAPVSKETATMSSSSYLQEFENRVDAEMSRRRIPRSKATANVVAADPVLHRLALAEANRDKPGVVKNLILPRA